MSNERFSKVLTVAFALCIVCSVIVSTAAVMLKPAQEANQALADVEQFFAQTEARLSRFQPESELSQLNRAAGQPFATSALLFELVETALAWRGRTAGIFVRRTATCRIQRKKQHSRKTYAIQTPFR